MRPDDADLAYLWDMLRAAEDAVRYVAGKTYDHYLADDLLRAGVERKVQIIGEAARHVSRAFQEAHAHIPWNPIVVQRHRLVHEYGDIRHDLIREVATIHAPALVELLRAIVPPQGPDAR